MDTVLEESSVQVGSSDLRELSYGEQVEASGGLRFCYRNPEGKPNPVRYSFGGLSFITQETWDPNQRAYVRSGGVSLEQAFVQFGLTSSNGVFPFEAFCRQQGFNVFR